MCIHQGGCYHATPRPLITFAKRYISRCYIQPYFDPLNFQTVPLLFSTIRPKTPFPVNLRLATSILTAQPTMAVKGPSPSTPAHPDLTRAQITALETYGSKATRNALLSISQPALTNPLITCLICIHPYHSANVEGNTETPVITACGHIFGNKCIKQWLEEENGTSGTKNEKTCPMCRFSLKYRECGCVIQAVPAFGNSTLLPFPPISTKPTQTR